MIEDADGAIVFNGRFGTLSEFSIAVEEGHRDKKIGKALIEALFEELRTQKIFGLKVLVGRRSHRLKKHANMIVDNLE